METYVLFTSYLIIPDPTEKSVCLEDIPVKKGCEIHIRPIKMGLLITESPILIALTLHGIITRYLVLPSWTVSPSGYGIQLRLLALALKLSLSSF